MATDPLAVLAQLLRAAADAAAGDPRVLDELFRDHLDRGTRELDAVMALPAAGIDRLRADLDPPDWWNVLPLLLLKLRDLAPDQLTLGLAAPAGWSRMLTLAYTPPGVTEAALTVGFGVTDSADAVGVPVRRGIVLRGGPRCGQTRFGQGPLRLAVEVAGETGARWEWAFGSGAAAPEGQAAGAVTLTWSPPPLPGSAAAGITIGAFELSAELSVAAPHYRFTLALASGGDRASGVVAHLEPTALVGLPLALAGTGAASAGFDPTAVLEAGRTPRFSLYRPHL